MPGNVLLFSGACLASAAALAAGTRVEMVVDGRATGVIVVPDAAPWVVRHAGEELSTYFRKMTGAVVPVVVASEEAAAAARNRILLGREFTTMPEFPPPALPYWGGTDGYVLRTVATARSNDLVIAGNTDRATLFGAYWLLEEFCGVGFFWDGEYVPPCRDLVLVDIAVQRTPYFTIREHFQGCAFAYTTDHWTLAEWQRELDWTAWKGFNEVMLPGEHTQTAVGDYARRLGLAILGDDGHAWQLHPHPEQRWDLTPDEMRAQVLQEARSQVQALEDSGDPQRHYECSGWAFTADPWYWSYETTKAYLSEFPKGRLVIWDLWGDALPMYELYDYFFGHYWAFTLLHTMGQMNHFHTDIPQFLARVREVVEDPRGANCIGFCEMSESIHHNLFLFELAMDVGWDPRAVELETFIQRFCRLRYGEAAGPRLATAWRRLTDSVYRHNYWPTPAYMLAPGVDPDFINREDLQGLFDRFQYVRPCWEAWTTALAACDDLANHPLYAHDLIDLGRQVVFELFDYHYLQLLSAYAKQDAAAFGAHLAASRTILDGLQTLLSSDSRYWLQTQIDKLKAHGDPALNRISAFGEPFTSPPEEELEKIRQLQEAGDWETLCRLRWQSTGWGDYQRTDLYELLVHNYRRRMEVFLKGLEAHFDAADRYGWTESLGAEYGRITADWRWNPHPMGPEERYAGTPVEAAAEVAARFAPLVPERILPLMGPELSVGEVGWEEDFSDPGRWTCEGEVRFERRDGTTRVTAPQKGGSYSITLEVDLAQYPILVARFRPLFHRGHARLFADWVDAEGQPHRSFVLGEGDSQRWQELRTHLGRLLGLIGQPQRLRKLTVTFPYQGHKVEWGALQLCAEGDIPPPMRGKFSLLSSKR